MPSCPQPTAPSCVTPAIGPVRIHDFPKYNLWPDGRVWDTRRNVFVAVSFDKKGYPIVNLSKSVLGTYCRCSTKIHRLLGMYFIPNPEAKLFVDHRDQVTDNNALTNLRWVTKAENCQNISVTTANNTGTRGIYNDFRQMGKPWIASICINKKQVSKSFATEEEAIAWRKAMELEHYIQ